MDYDQIVVTLLYSVITIIIIPILTVLARFLISNIINKIDNKKTADIIKSISNIIIDTLNNIAISYVDSLKTKGKLDEIAQNEIILKLTEIIINQLTDDMKSYIELEYGSLEHYIENQVKSLAESSGIF